MGTQTLLTDEVRSAKRDLDRYYQFKDELLSHPDDEIAQQYLGTMRRIEKSLLDAPPNRKMVRGARFYLFTERLTVITTMVSAIYCGMSLLAHISHLIA